MHDIRFLDNTLRDGSHFNKHSFSPQQVSDVASRLDSVQLNVIEVGHGNGLGASSLQIGLSKYSDIELIKAAKKAVSHAKIGAHVIPGIATYAHDVYPAIQEGVSYIRVACHCTEADITQSMIARLVSKNVEVWGALMMSHMTKPECLALEALKMQNYGASGVVFYDSAGTFTPHDITSIVQTIRSHLSVEIGFHAHNNLQLAAANSLAAIEAGATFIDGSLAGFGAGAGNLSLPHFFAVANKMSLASNLRWQEYLNVMQHFLDNQTISFPDSSEMNVVSGINGVFSGFVSHIIRIADQYSISPVELFKLCGDHKLVAGQEDLIVEIAQSHKYNHA